MDDAVNKDDVAYEKENVGEGEYTVEDQDCIYSIAQKKGLQWQNIWEDPHNIILKEKRKHPGILLPGDKLYIPGLKKYKSHKNHTITMNKKTIKIAIKVISNGIMYRNKDYTLTVKDKDYTGKTDKNGILLEEIPIDAKKGKLKLKDPDREVDITIGMLNPIEDVSGIQQRLSNLGYYKGDITGEMDDATQDALYDFQMANGLKISLKLDGPFYNKLIKIHGC